MTRKERRETMSGLTIFSDSIKITKQYFPQLIDKLDKLTDTRHQSYVKYSMSTIAITRLVGLLSGIKSMRETTQEQKNVME